MMRYFVIISLLITLSSCRPDPFVPKPRGYYKVELPEHKYQSFNEPDFPYSFEYPVYGKIIKDTLFFGHKPENPYWINIDFPTIGSKIYISYKSIMPTQPLGKLMEDAHEMSFSAHIKRADYINPESFNNSEFKVYGILYTLGGNTASAYQFVVTDSIKHFLRGALYFDVSPNADSLRPANEFLRDDMKHLMETLRWNN